MAEKRDVAAFLMYNDNTKVGKVLARQPLPRQGNYIEEIAMARSQHRLGGYNGPFSSAAGKEQHCRS